MIKTIMVVLGLVMFADALMEKWKIYDRLMGWSAKQKTKFFYLMITCNFCMMFHLSWIVTLIYCVANEFSWDVLIVPMVVSGLIHLKSR